MKRNIKLPACHLYIQGEKTADILYTLAAKSAVYHMSDITGQEFHSLLMATGKIKADHPLPQIIGNISCFTISSEYLCGFVCHTCPYSKTYKNKVEIEESILISYALKNFQNYQFLKESGLTSQVFTSLLLINERPYGKIVATLPLLKLTYHYLEHKANPDTDFLCLPSAIADALDQNNKGKLLPKNIQAIRNYLLKLQNAGNALTKEKIQSTLNLLIPKSNESPYGNSVSVNEKQMETVQEKAESSLDKKEPINENRCIEGLLSGSETSGNISGKNEMSDVVYLPASFSKAEISQTNYPFYHIQANAATLSELEVFLQFNPLLGAEIVEDSDTKKQMLLLCASNQFFYMPTDQEPILSMLRLYFAKSSIRRQICVEPYKLSYFFQNNSIFHKNIYAIHTAYKVLSGERGDECIKPLFKLIKELTSKTNLYNYSPYIFSMPLYIKMYEVISNHTLMKKKEAQKRFHKLSYVDSFLGISYDLKDITEVSSPLFDLDKNREYLFRYNHDMIMKAGVYSVTFTFSSKSPIESLVVDILYDIAKKDFAKIQGYRLLNFKNDSFTIATTSEHYEELCSSVANISTYLAKKQGIIPLIMKEDLRK